MLAIYVLSADISLHLIVIGWPTLVAIQEAWLQSPATTKLLEESNTPEETNLIDQIDLDALLETDDDKGGYLVVMTIDQYSHTCNRILKNTEWYRKVPQGKMAKAQSEFNNLIFQAYNQGTIPKSTWEFLKTD